MKEMEAETKLRRKKGEKSVVIKSFIKMDFSQLMVRRRCYKLEAIREDGSKYSDHLVYLPLP